MIVLCVAGRDKRATKLQRMIKCKSNKIVFWKIAIEMILTVLASLPLNFCDICVFKPCHTNIKTIDCAPDLTMIISETAGRTEGRKRRSRWWIRHQFLLQMSLILIYPKGLLVHMAVLRNRSLPSLSISYLLSSPYNLISAFQIWLWTLFRIVESQTLSILILSIFNSTSFVL